MTINTRGKVCGYCGGKSFEDEDDETVCMDCGEVIQDEEDLEDDDDDYDEDED